MRHFSYLLYLCPCLGLGLFMSYLGDPFFIFIFIFNLINRIISWIQSHLFFYLFFRICPIIFRWRMWTISKQRKFSVKVLLSICLIFANFSMALLRKVAYKKDVHLFFCFRKWLERNKGLKINLTDGNLIRVFNPFVPNAPFLYPLKTSENRDVFWCFQGVEKVCTGNEWAKEYLIFQFS